jgi:hypothetical protein
MITESRNERRMEKKDTAEQFIYKPQEGFGPLKMELRHSAGRSRDEICTELERKFAFLFDKFEVNATRPFWINSLCRLML